MAESERADTCSIISDAPAVEELSDDYAAASLAEAVPADADNPVAMATDKAAASDDNSEASIISAAFVAVNDTTRRTTRMTTKLEIILRNAFLAVDKADDAYAFVIVLSDHIDSNHPSHAVRARLASDHRDVHFQAHVIVAALRLISRLRECSRVATLLSITTKALTPLSTTQSKQMMKTSARICVAQCRPVGRMPPLHLLPPPLSRKRRLPSSNPPRIYARSSAATTSYTGLSPRS